MYNLVAVSVSECLALNSQNILLPVEQKSVATILGFIDTFVRFDENFKTIV